MFTAHLGSRGSDHIDKTQTLPANVTDVPATQISRTCPTGYELAEGEGILTYYNGGSSITFMDGRHTERQLEKDEFKYEGQIYRYVKDRSHEPGSYICIKQGQPGSD